MTLFSAEHLTMIFGGLTAVDDFSLELKEGDLIGIDRAKRSREDNRF